MRALTEDTVMRFWSETSGLQGPWFWRVVTCWRKAGKEQKCPEDNAMGQVKKEELRELLLSC